MSSIVPLIILIYYRDDDALYDAVDSRINRLPPSTTTTGADNRDDIRKALASSGSHGSGARRLDRVLQLDSREAKAVSERFVYPCLRKCLLKVGWSEVWQ